MSFDRYLNQHPAAQAQTVHSEPEPKLNGSKRHAAARYPRGIGSEFTVYHDPLVHPPHGLYRVYVGAALIGSQLSFPSADDCARMDSPARYGHPSAHQPAERAARAAVPKRCAMCRKMLDPSSFRQLTDGRRHSYCNPCRSERETARYYSKRDGAGSHA